MITKEKKFEEICIGKLDFTKDNELFIKEYLINAETDLIKDSFSYLFLSQIIEPIRTLLLEEYKKRNPEAKELNKAKKIINKSKKDIHLSYGKKILTYKSKK